MSARILVVEDEEALTTLLRYNLDAEGYDVETVARGDDADTRLKERVPDLIVLDWMLPGLSGIELCRRLRARPETKSLPIIMLTARGEEGDKIRGLNSGADDYVTKPFGIGELMTRIEIALQHRAAAGRAPSHEFRTAGLVVDLDSHRVTRDNHDIPLTPREFETLRLLVCHAGKVLTHQQILREIWGPAHINETQYLRVHIGKLRKKLEPEPARPRFIITEPAVGYRFKPADEA